MKARTKIEKQVAASNEKLTVLSPKVITWAVRKVAGHVCFRTSAHKCTCGDCSRQFDYEGKGKSVCCPYCGTRLQIKDTLKRTIKEAYYFSSLEVIDHLQVQRVFRLETTFRKGMPMEVDYWEACRLWLNAEGKLAVTARARTLSYYVDCFDWASEISLKRPNEVHWLIADTYVYPHYRLLPELKRNGFNGEYHNILPYDLFTAILSDSRAETLLKAGQYPMLRHYIRSSFDMERYWASIKICIRNGYTIADGSMWRDTIDLLRHFGKDTNSPKYVCPADLKAEHDRLMHKRNKEIERKKLEERIRQAKKHEKAYRKLKGIFFGIAFTDGTLQVRVLESVAEFAAEGTELHHCVFSNSYFLEKNSLILSATIDGKRIETVEVSLKTLEVVQSRGLHNSNTEYHDRIVNLVNSNVNLIRQRMEAA